METKTLRANLELCNCPRHHEAEATRFQKAIAPYQNQIDKLLPFADFLILAQTVPVYLNVAGTTLLAIAALEQKAPRYADLYVVGGFPNVSNELANFVAEVTDTHMPELVKISARVSTATQINALVTAGYRLVGTLEKEALIEGRLTDMVVLERVNPALVGEDLKMMHREMDEQIAPVMVAQEEVEEVEEDLEEIAPTPDLPVAPTPIVQQPKPQATVQPTPKISVHRSNRQLTPTQMKPGKTVLRDGMGFDEIIMGKGSLA